MVRPTQICDICQEQVSGSHLARHKKRRHGTIPGQRPLPTAVEQSERVADVLLACGLAPEYLGDWDIEDLNKLPNIRRYKPAPRRHHTPWQVVTDAELRDLPSLEDLLVEFAYRTRRNKSIAARTEGWRGNNRVDFTPTDWVTWTKRILEGEQVQTRVLNMHIDSMLAADKSRERRNYAAEVAARYMPTQEALRIRQTQPSANITPRGTRTDVHHDSEHHLSTAIGLAGRPNRPLKLWLLWPSTELRHLATCYSDTKAALTTMDHGCFFVQMPGESVFAPPNSPHAVLALESCYLYGNTFSTDSWAYDPSMALVDIRSGQIDDAACQERLKRLRLGLQSSEFRQAFIDQFIETWALESLAFRRYEEEFETLVTLWSQDIRDTGRCAWCIAAGRSDQYNVGTDSLAHARTHLEG